MNPATAPTAPLADTAAVVEVEAPSVEPQPDQIQPHPPEWYDTPEFRRQLLLHFQEACRKAVATNPPGMPG